MYRMSSEFFYFRMCVTVLTQKPNLWVTMPLQHKEERHVLLETTSL